MNTMTTVKIHGGPKSGRTTLAAELAHEQTLSGRLSDRPVVVLARTGLEARQFKEVMRGLNVEARVNASAVRRVVYGQIEHMRKLRGYRPMFVVVDADATELELEDVREWFGRLDVFTMQTAGPARVVTL